MGCGSKTTTETKIPEMSAEERSLMNLGIDYLLAGPISEQFYVKPVEKTTYKNQALVDQLNKERGSLQGELDELKRRQSAYSTPMTTGPGGTTGPAGFGAKRNELRAVDQRIGEIEMRMSGLDSKYRKETEGDRSTTYTDYQLLDKPPPGVRKALLDMDEQSRNKANSILENHGYSSAEFRNYAKTVKMPPKKPAGTV